MSGERAGITTARSPGSARLKSKGHFRDAGRDIETGGPFDADRLQCDRIPGAADQHVGADPDADRRAAGGAGISSRQRAGRQIGGRRND